MTKQKKYIEEGSKYSFEEKINLYGASYRDYFIVDEDDEDATCDTEKSILTNKETKYVSPKSTQAIWLAKKP